MTVLLLSLAFIPAQLLVGQPGRHSEWSDFPQKAQILARQLGLTEKEFPSTLSTIDRQTADRLREGELDHLIYYMLQSKSFTDEALIEPAKSPVAYMASPNREIPVSVERRIVHLARALSNPSDERQLNFSKLVANFDVVPLLRTEYMRAMKFLYEKEIGCGSAPVPQACIASLYSKRGHSSDTSIQSQIVIERGLSWLCANRGIQQINRVLIIGPGVDFAPRTGLKDDGYPRVYQPLAAARMLHSLNLAGPGLKVDCADINPRVLTYARSTCDTVYKLNIITERLDASPGYDLIVATNVLLYLKQPELLLAMNNIRMMLRANGIFLHNDARFKTRLFGKASGLPAIHFADVPVDARHNPPLTDRFIVHATAPPAL